MSAPWMPLYVADYLADTGHLSAAEHGAYLMLIMHYWRAGSLPTDEKALARISRMTAREWQKSRDTLAAFFDADWKHERIENELQKSAVKSERRAESGSRGGNAKALKTKDTPLANATGLPEQKPAFALASSSQSQPQEEANASSAGELADFRKGIMAAFHAAGSTALPDTSRAAIWLENGWKPSVCLAVIAEVLARKKSITAIKYFEQAIADAHEKPVGVAVQSGKFGKPLSTAIRLGPDDARDAAKALGQVYVLRDSPEGDAWNDYKRATKGVSQWWDQNGGNYFPSALPPVKQVAAA